MLSIKYKYEGGGPLSRECNTSEQKIHTCRRHIPSLTNRISFSEEKIFPRLELFCFLDLSVFISVYFKYINTTVGLSILTNTISRSNEEFTSREFAAELHGVLVILRALFPSPFSLSPNLGIIIAICNENKGIPRSTALTSYMYEGVTKVRGHFRTYYKM